MDAHKPGEIDYISFVGSGEPTLHSDIGWMIRQIKAMTDIPLAVITNGSLLYLPEVRNDLSAADVVMPTVNAGNADLYKRIARPHPEITFARVAEGLISFRQEFLGLLWVETMLIKGSTTAWRPCVNWQRSCVRFSPMKSTSRCRRDRPRKHG